MPDVGNESLARQVTGVGVGTTHAEEDEDSTSPNYKALTNGDAKGKAVARSDNDSAAQVHPSSPQRLGSPPTSPKRPTFSPQDSPSSRTGPPRSLSYNFAKSTRSRKSTMSTDNDAIDEEEYFSDLETLDAPPFNRATSDFRGALEYSDPEQRDREREAQEKRERLRQSRLAGEVWGIPMGRWLKLSEEPAQSPTEDDEGATTDGGGLLSYFTAKTSAAFSFSDKDADNRDAKSRRGSGEQSPDGQEATVGGGDDATSTATPVAGPSRPRFPSRKAVNRSRSMPYMRRDSTRTVGWGRVRDLLPTVARKSRETHPEQGQESVVRPTVNITDELIAGGLSTLMLRLWFERDEHGNRRVPILFHRLRVRISDSLAPLSGNKAVFRIECEYANGAARWVVYRQLRDFMQLHTHYRLSNAYYRNVEALPDFPRTSLPYFKFLKKETRDQHHEMQATDFAVLQREALENYLIGLIRSVMFHPASNRLAGFLEISALSIALAQSGGWQAKAGMLRVEASGKNNNFGRKGISWTQKKAPRWCCVRDSYIVALEEPGDLTVWDVFLFDSDFKIERPRRYLRQGLHLFHPDLVQVDMNGHSPDEKGKRVQKAEQPDEHQHQHHRSGTITGTLSRVKHRMGKALHFTHRPKDDRHSTTVASISRRRTRSSSVSSSDSSSSGEDNQRTETRIDPSTNMDPLHEADGEGHMAHQPSNPEELAQAEASQKNKKKKRKDVSKHTFYISNSQTRLKLYAKNERQMMQWMTALEKAAKQSNWVGNNRFDSFAPIRLNVAAQWLVDGRDYMWNLSRAILLARECIYIHDWWLSPELQMRRPNKEKYRLDRLLERKAKEGVKIYVILYQEVTNRTTPTDSGYTKQRLVSLHPNIMVQRSPSHFQTGTFYWAHHEKLCVIDEAIAFMGGIDLCFGRWDTPQHVLLDDGSGDVIWPGKDYSNPRLSDFFALNKPEEDMYDRSKVARMPWHDIGMNVVGQPARDLCRHFVQRWNFLLRIKKHSRAMPFLLPPPEFKAHDLQEQGLTGTCEMQICRSAGPWSMGTPFKTECSVQNAYLKAIQMSEHFVYIENQFFITSTVINDTIVENRIGDAIVHRIIRAHREGTPWKACILIPVLPGFPMPIDHSDASAIRIIVECQSRTLFRGPDSIFSRLRKEGIDPDEYIAVFALRNWAKMPGNVLTTEQIYIHGKVCIVDDRLAIIGSANINERSQRGDRDSELAAVIKDTDMIDGFMAGKPFKVGRFAHTLRVRLMREHLGVDVDALYEEDLKAAEPMKDATEQEAWDPNHEQRKGPEDGVTQRGKDKRRTPAGEAVEEVVDSAEQAIHGTGDGTARDVGYYMRKAGFKTSGVDGSANDKQLEEERRTFNKKGEKVTGFASAVVPTLEEKTIMEHRPPKEQANGELPLMDSVDRDSNGSIKGDLDQARVQDSSGELYGAPAGAEGGPQKDDAPPRGRTTSPKSPEEDAAVDARKMIRKHLGSRVGAKPWTLPVPAPEVDPDGFGDPICDKFWKNMWVACAVHNTEIYRKVFHAIPDDTVTTWKQYKEFVQHHERLSKPPKGQSGPDPIARMPSEAGAGENAPSELNETLSPEFNKNDKTKSSPASSAASHANVSEEARQRAPSRAGGSEPFDKRDREEMEALLGELRGHLVIYPTRFLEGEDAANNFLFNADRMLPMPIYD